MQELQEHGYKTSPGTLYPLLHKMKAEGLLSRTTKNIDGRISKLYSATPFGEEILQEAVGKAAELFHELKE